jgi:hypothetical protein
MWRRGDTKEPAAHAEHRPTGTISPFNFEHLEGGVIGTVVLGAFDYVFYLSVSRAPILPGTHWFNTREEAIGALPDLLNEAD